MIEIKQKYKFILPDGKLKELKYSKCTNKKILSIAKEIVDAFWNNTSYFRAIVINQGVAWFDIVKFWRENENYKMKFARLYKNFSELLILHNTQNVYNAVLLTDELTKPKTDSFFKLLKVF